MDVKCVGHLRPRWQLVGGRAARGHAAIVIPQEFLECQPAYPLDKPALHLAPIDDRRNRISDVLEDVGADQTVGTRKSIDLDLGYGRTERKIEERLPCHGGVVPADPRRTVVPRGGQGHARTVGLLHELRKSELSFPDPHLSVGKVDFRGIGLEVFTGELHQALADVAGILLRESSFFGDVRRNHDLRTIDKLK